MKIGPVNATITYNNENLQKLVEMEILCGRM